MRTRIDLEDYNYNLDRELIAYYPTQKREESRLMVLDRKREGIEIKIFKDMLIYFKKGDVLVRNVSKVIPARLFANRDMGGRIEILFLGQPIKGENIVLMKLRGRLRMNEEIYLPGDKRAIYIGRQDGFNVIRLLFDPGFDYLLEYGNMPLPPYIKREAEALDRERYQTVYAKNPGSVAAPTAGLHFSLELISKIESIGVDIVDLLLHVSYATFKPLDKVGLGRDRLHEEHYEMSEKSASKINKAKKDGRRIIAVGTTTVRVLESQAYCEDGDLGVKPGEGMTDIFIKPGYKFKIIDALITNFHLPRTSLLLLVSAFAGRDLLFSGYKKAVERRFRFYSYGDAMFIV
ncbi:MAG: tRNA preQ1(34) S-adenosylmethionine ribosyltransferase-isomerase QueA [Candidatus Kaelpia imicola]|nr:tRNA preQ1(34) S-adenosylmethionine ribosyltransferase-isomerase QueA [Candidatus Kaelpia imicola]